MTTMPPPQRRGMPAWMWALLGVAAVVIVGLVVAVVILATRGGDEGSVSPAAGKASTSTAAKVFSVTGKVTLIDAGVHNDGGVGCWGTGGYSDMVGGAQVVVRDAHGTSVAVGALQTGQLKDNSVTCVFGFDVTNVPAGSGVYSVEVSHRGQVSFSEADAGTALNLTLGE